MLNFLRAALTMRLAVMLLLTGCLLVSGVPDYASSTKESMLDTLDAIEDDIKTALDSGIATYAVFEEDDTEGADGKGSGTETPVNERTLMYVNCGDSTQEWRNPELPEEDVFEMEKDKNGNLRLFVTLKLREGGSTRIELWTDGETEVLLDANYNFIRKFSNVQERRNYEKTYQKETGCLTLPYAVGLPAGYTDGLPSANGLSSPIGGCPPGYQVHAISREFGSAVEAKDKNGERILRRRGRNGYGCDDKLRSETDQFGVKKQENYWRNAAGAGFQTIGYAQEHNIMYSAYLHECHVDGGNPCKQSWSADRNPLCFVKYHYDKVHDKTENYMVLPQYKYARGTCQKAKVSIAVDLDQNKYDVDETEYSDYMPERRREYEHTINSAREAHLGFKKLKGDKRVEVFEKEEWVCRLENGMSPAFRACEWDTPQEMPWSLAG